jgi:hypothetical protein
MTVYLKKTWVFEGAKKEVELREKIKKECLFFAYFWNVFTFSFLVFFPPLKGGSKKREREKGKKGT